MSHQSTALAPDSPFAPTGRVVPLPKKKARRSRSTVPTGFYRRKGKTIWHFRKVIDGTLYNKSTGFDELKLAIAWAEDFVKATREGNLGWDSRGVPTVKEFFDNRTRTTTYDRWLVPFVEAHATIKITQVTDDTCREWIETRRETKTQYGRLPIEGTIRTECSHLRAFFNRAVGPKKFLRENPWSMVNPENKVKLPRRSVRTRMLEMSEQPEFLAALRSHSGWDIHGAMLERMAKVLLGSGMRRNEICFLQPGMVHHGALHLPTWLTKGNKPRVVPVGTDILALLDAQREVRKLDPRSTDRLFEIDPIYLDNLFRQASDRAQLVPAITPHDLRRTYASRMAFKVPPKVLQTLLGHSDISTTMTHYVTVDAKKMAELVLSVGSPLEG